MSIKMQKSAFHEGKEAYENGLERWGHGYPMNSRQATQFQRGWSAAEQEALAQAA